MYIYSPVLGFLKRFGPISYLLLPTYQHCLYASSHLEIRAMLFLCSVRCRRKSRE